MRGKEVWERGWGSEELNRISWLVVGFVVFFRGVLESLLFEDNGDCRGVDFCFWEEGVRRELLEVCGGGEVRGEDFSFWGVGLVEGSRWLNCFVEFCTFCWRWEMNEEDIREWGMLEDIRDSGGRECGGSNGFCMWWGDDRSVVDEILFDCLVDMVKDIWFDFSGFDKLFLWRLRKRLKLDVRGLLIKESGTEFFLVVVEKFLFLVRFVELVMELLVLDCRGFLGLYGRVNWLFMCRILICIYKRDEW